MKVHTNCLFLPQITRIIFLLILCFETQIIADCLFQSIKSNVILSKAKNLVYVGLCFRDPSLRSLR